VNKTAPGGAEDGELVIDADADGPGRAPADREERSHRESPGRGEADVAVPAQRDRLGGAEGSAAEEAVNASAPRAVS
jgi:hypothetical protein